MEFSFISIFAIMLDTLIIIPEMVHTIKGVRKIYRGSAVVTVLDYLLKYFCIVLMFLPLGKILEKLNVIKVKDDLLHLDLNRWLGKNRSIIDTLTKVHVNHAVLREAELVVMGNVNIAALFKKISEQPIDNDWQEERSESEVTPIKQKDA